MKKLLTAILIVFGSVAHGAVIFPITSLSEYIGNFPTNYNQSISNLNAAIAAGGVAQSPFTNDIDAAGNSIENLDAPEITNTTIFIRLWGTNVLSLQGTTNVALNGVSLMDGPSDGNTPQGPWTNVVNFNGFSGSGGNFIQLTNQTAIRIGTNLLAVQGWPDATNIAWNGAALINVSGGGGGGAYAFQGTNNIAPTNGFNSITDATTQDATISGGFSNRIESSCSGSYIGGGMWQIIVEGAYRSIIGGGTGNVIYTADDAGILSGDRNRVDGSGSVIGGGLLSRILGSHSVIGGGEYNTNTANGSWGFIGGGHMNYNDAGSSTIGGGWLNRILDGPSGGDACVIAGGDENVIGGTEGAAIGGGWLNNIGAGSQFATIIGGVYGDIGSAATYSTVLGGLNNDVANSVSYAVVAGRRAKANHSGTFVWADSTDADFASTAADTFNIRASSGVYVKSGTMGAAVRQPLYLGAYTNANPTTIKPTMQMDWYYDAGSNYILRTTDGTTNGWAHLP